MSVLNPHRPSDSHRVRILAVVEATEGPQTAQAIARLARLTYKQTVDTLNALHNHARVQRTGRKFTARWSRAQPEVNPAQALEQAFAGFFRPLN